jgi:spermidine synthase
MHFEEKHNFIKHGLKVKEKLYQIQSKYQKIEVYKTEDLGNLMVIDDSIMLNEKDEFIYHEMISHIPLLTHKNPKKVLIIGGGDGGSAREVLKYKDITVDMVEIDQEVINVSKKFFPSIGDWNNPNLNLIIDDGIKFVKRCKDKSYDVVLIDSTDDKNHASVLFKQVFYAEVYRILKDDGLMSIQGSSWFVDMDQHKSLLQKLGENFKIVMPYRYEMLSYPGINWNFILASKKYHPLKDLREITSIKYKYIIHRYIKLVLYCLSM